MFKGFIFVILAAFVAFGVTLFMATNEMEARLVTAAAVPAEAGGTKPQKTAKAKKSRSTNRSGTAPTSGKKRPAGTSPTHVIAPIPKNSPSIDRWRLLD